MVENLDVIDLLDRVWIAYCGHNVLASKVNQLHWVPLSVVSINVVCSAFTAKKGISNPCAMLRFMDSNVAPRPNQSFNPDATSASHFPRQAFRFLDSPQRAASVALVNSIR